MATLKNSTINDTGFLRLPPGTTAQRPAVPLVGMIRYNTTLGFSEQYTVDGWQGIAPPPVITTVTPSSFSGESGTTITVNGANFDQTASVSLILTGGTILSTTTTRVNSSQLTFPAPRDLLASESPASVKVTNGSGLSAQADNIITFDDVPVFTTTSTSLGSIYDSNRSSYSLSTAAATDSNGGTITGYSIVSGSLPSGLSFNTSTAAITGTASSVGTTTTSNFTVRATDNAGNTTDKAFSITVYAPQVVSYTSGSGTFSVPTGITSVQVLVVAGGGGGGAAEGFETGGGGGAGGLIYNSSFPVTPGGSVPYSVGGGGSGANPQSNQPPNSSPSVAAGKGGNSNFGPISCTGGGIGGGQYWDGQPGGSGGGDAGNIANGGGSGTPGQGNPGGNGQNNAASSCSGGGGGHANAGESAPGPRSGNGGSGSTYSISGSSLTYAGGGGGGGSEDGGRPRGAGGSGGGGNGGNRGQTGQSATTNRGSGGGGSVEAYGGAGAPGIVIVRY